MILSGILHSSLGGFMVIRGVASLGDLARCSRFDPAYQRNLIDIHKAEIERFLADRQYLFFPEVVLSALLRFDFEKARGRAVDPLGDIFSGCPSSDDLRLISGLRKGGSGSSGFKAMRLASGAASVLSGWSGA